MLRSLAVFVFASALTGCAEILGLDGGDPLEDDGGSSTVDDLSDDAGAAGEAAVGSAPASDSGPIAEATDARATADASTITCPVGKADCNGFAKDGCETNLDDPSHCGSCTNQCAPLSACKDEICCLNPKAPCTSGSECCSGECGGVKGCH